MRDWHVILIVSGGRDFKPDKSPLHDRAWSELRSWISNVQPHEVWHGDAEGADKLAGDLAVKGGADVRKFPAAWQHFGNSAGWRRNTEMAEAAALAVARGSHVVWAILPGGDGTADAFRKAKATKGVRVVRMPTEQRDLFDDDALG